MIGDISPHVWKQKYTSLSHEYMTDSQRKFLKLLYGHLTKISNVWPNQLQTISQLKHTSHPLIQFLKVINLHLKTDAFDYICLLKSIPTNSKKLSNL